MKGGRIQAADINQRLGVAAFTISAMRIDVIMILITWLTSTQMVCITKWLLPHYTRRWRGFVKCTCIGECNHPFDDLHDRDPRNVLLGVMLRRRREQTQGYHAAMYLHVILVLSLFAAQCKLCNMLQKQ